MYEETNEKIVSLLFTPSIFLFFFYFAETHFRFFFFVINWMMVGFRAVQYYFFKSLERLSRYLTSADVWFRAFMNISFILMHFNNMYVVSVYGLCVLFALASRLSGIKIIMQFKLVESLT